MATARRRVALAGCHRMLSRDLTFHNWAAAFAAVPEAEVVAMYDKGADTRAAFQAVWGPVPAFADFDAMLEASRPEVLCVATRQTQHAEQIGQAAAAGVRAILCEKPLATSMAEVDGIVACVERYGISFAYGLDRRWTARYEGLVALVRDGAIGEVRTILLSGLHNLIFHGCHWFDRLLAFAGDPEVEWVAGAVETLDDQPADSRRRLDPSGSGQVRLSNGVDAFVTPAGATLELEVIGSRGRLLVLNDGAAVHLWQATADGKSLVPASVDATSGEPPWPRVVRNLLGPPYGAPSRCDVHCAKRASEIGFAVHQSHRQGGQRITPAAIDRSLRVESFPWGNE